MNISIVSHGITKFLNRRSSLIFFILLIACSYFYDYHEILTLRPQSVHQWRQTDCLSVTKNYYEDGMNFTKPAIHNLISDKRTTGISMGEFPVLYYFVAVLWKIFGPHEFIYRLVNVLIAFTGLFALYKTLIGILKDKFWAMFIPLLLFTSPVYVYYSNNFLTNITALNIVLIAWYFFHRFYSSGLNRYLMFTFLLFMFAMLLKISSAISFIFLFSVFVLEILKILRVKKNERIFNKPVLSLLGFALVFAVVAAWFLYARYYNRTHGGDYCLLSFFPVWSMSHQEILNALKGIGDLWIYQYFSMSVLILTGVFFIVGLFTFKKNNKLLWLSLPVIFTGVVLFILGWFKALNGHDYYITNLLIFIVFIYTCFLNYLRLEFPRLSRFLPIKIAFAIFLVYNVYYCADNMYQRYHSNWNTNWGKSTKFPYEDHAYITPYLRSLGITRNDKVISLPDPSFTRTLYLMDQKGWTLSYARNKDSLVIANTIERGAKYLIIGDTAIYEETYIQPFLKYPVGNYNSIDIYDLQPYVVSHVSQP